MNRYFILLFGVTFILISSFSCEKTKNPVIAEIPPQHPRILLLEGEEAAVRKTLSSENKWGSVSSFIIYECNKIVKEPPVERVLTGRRLLSKSREALRRIFYLSYAWRMTSDVRYLERAEQEMLAVSAFSDWNPSHFLDVAEMTMAAAIGYDWLYDKLSEESRNIIKTAIVEKGLKPSLLPANNGWTTRTNNWNQVCNAGMTFGALAVYEDEKELALQIIDRAVTSIKLPMGDYDPDGAYPEGFGYWGYGTSFHVMFISAMEKAFGDKYDLGITEGFLKTARYLENMTGPTGVPFNYSDCGTSANMDPAMFWFGNILDDPSILWSDKYQLLNKSLPDDRLLPALLIWCEGLTINEISAPPERIWVGQGKNPVALMRTSWADKNAIYVGLKAGSPSANHAHMDVGSFVMDANGERWAMDFGSQDYNSLEQAGVDLWNMAQYSERWDVFRYNNLAHNTLTVNGQYQRVSGKASITGYYDQTDMLTAVTDLSTLYDGQLKKTVRGIAIVDKQYVMVRDEVETLTSETTIRWNMVTSALVTITGNNSAELFKNNKKLILKVVEPGTISLKIWNTVSPNSYDAANPGTTMVGFEVVVPANSTANLTVLLLPDGAIENSVVSAKNISDWPKSIVK
ncbi:MAG: heparinase II/III family protein [Bacteroidales bacterium]|jgi:hypothetical protein|nr:heparinase II/III family protein [Bacteroidales bacterium]